MVPYVTLSDGLHGYYSWQVHSASMMCRISRNMQNGVQDVPALCLCRLA